MAPAVLASLVQHISFANGEKDIYNLVFLILFF